MKIEIHFWTFTSHNGGLSSIFPSFFFPVLFCLFIWIFLVSFIVVSSVFTLPVISYVLFCLNETTSRVSSGSAFITFFSCVRVPCGPNRPKKQPLHVLFLFSFFFFWIRRWLCDVRKYFSTVVYFWKRPFLSIEQWSFFFSGSFCIRLPSLKKNKPFNALSSSPPQRFLIEGRSLKS